MAKHGRQWLVSEVAWSAEHLARHLTGRIKPPDAAYAYERYVLLNDSESPDGDQEYAIVDADTLEHLDSVVFSSMEVWEVWEFLLDLADGNYDDMPTFGTVSRHRLRWPARHRARTEQQ